MKYIPEKDIFTIFTVILKTLITKHIYFKTIFFSQVDTLRTKNVNNLIWTVEILDILYIYYDL